MKNRAACISSVVLVSLLCFVHARETQREKIPLLSQTPVSQSATAKIENLLAGTGVTVPSQDAQLARQRSERTEATLEVRLRWDAFAVTGKSSPNLDPRKSGGVFIALERRQIGGEYPRHRSPQLSSDRILVAGVDTQGQLRTWTTVPDPRVIRGEAPGPTGQLSGQVLYRAQVEFLVALPDDPSVAEFRFYHPRWTGADFVLEPLGSAPIR